MAHTEIKISQGVRGIYGGVRIRARVRTQRGCVTDDGKVFPTLLKFHEVISTGPTYGPRVFQRPTDVDFLRLGAKTRG